MKINHEEMIVIPREEYERLCRLDGRVDALQGYIDEFKGYIGLEDIASILGINLAHYKRNCDEKKKENLSDIIEC